MGLASLAHCPTTHGDRYDEQQPRARRRCDAARGRALGCTAVPDRNVDVKGWSFTRAEAGWVWDHAGSPTHESSRSARAFPTLLECVNDAALHGYNRHVGERGDAPERRDRA